MLLILLPVHLQIYNFFTLHFLLKVSRKGLVEEVQSNKREKITPHRQHSITRN